LLEYFMANEKGLSCLLKVGTTATAATTFTTLEGQTDTNFNGSVALADSTDKSNSGWQTGIATTRSGTVQCSGNLYTTRTVFDLLETAWVTGATHNCQIIFDVAGNGYKGDFYVSELSVSGGVNDVAKYSLTLTPAAALTSLP
jgi:predicted secreted protein